MSLAGDHDDPTVRNSRLAVYTRQAKEPGHRLVPEEHVRAHVEVVGERQAAEYSGVNVRVIIGAVMVISAACAGLAGLLS